GRHRRPERSAGVGIHRRRAVAHAARGAVARVRLGRARGRWTRRRQSGAGDRRARHALRAAARAGGAHGARQQRLVRRTADQVALPVRVPPGDGRGAAFLRKRVASETPNSLSAATFRTQPPKRTWAWSVQFGAWRRTPTSAAYSMGSSPRTKPQKKWSRSASAKRNNAAAAATWTQRLRITRLAAPGRTPWWRVAAGTTRRCARSRRQTASAPASPACRAPRGDRPPRHWCPRPGRASRPTVARAPRRGCAGP